MPESLTKTALGRLFAQEQSRGGASWFSLPGGTPLYDPGGPAEELYFLRAGRLGAFRQEEGQEPQFLGVIRPGEPAGEMAFIAETPHSARVVALRDSEVLALPRDAFFEAADRDPAVMTELARLMILRSRQAATQASIGEPSVFGFVATNPGPPVRDLVEAVGEAIEALGYEVAVAGAESLQAPMEWFSNVERDHDFVLYAVETGEDAWKHVVGRQVDRLFRVGHGDQPPPPVAAKAYEPLQRQRLVDLILIHPAKRARPSGSAAWLDITEAARLFHIRHGDAHDIARIARLITGQSVGLVLSGGGARAYAHIGAIRALREFGVPIDFVAGASMGGIVAAGLAMGWDDAEMETRIRAAFVDSSPLDDIAFPILALTHGDKVRARLEQHFGDTQISDLWLPFFCVSSNLTSGAYHVHRRGVLKDALRASISLPGVLPPMVEDGEVLVDGAVMKNFPADVMRAFQLGPIIGVDVTRGRSINAADMHRPKSWLRWLLSGEWRKGPPIVALLMRAATVTTGRDLAASRTASDVLVTPKVDGVDIRDWGAFEPAVHAGYLAAIEALEALDKPVSELRRRPSLRERAALR
ncbi:patatin-like phospholipase family protein [Caulobacter segnis]|uniref:patatin-like phospholipase family protein n=1 Tax=Caulobacter segnis TaxID=88688 RepID=UPI00241022F3|nr:patatin-like phospholipase family protein [Caulobacter segnis]MDG2522269.1 patatin-like phospholipase family protein [Caulobacter segnis]